jgi:L-serine dehydratase
MNAISIFDMLKIGVGPSSSHTLGPWKAANAFAQHLQQFKDVQEVKVSLFGSLALTGKGHGTDLALLMGLSGEQPETVDLQKVTTLPQQVQLTHQLLLNGDRTIIFHPQQHIIFNFFERLPFHSNGMLFEAFDNQEKKIMEEIYYSIGGGFISRGEEVLAIDRVPPKYDCPNAIRLLSACQKAKLSIAELALQNELQWATLPEIKHRINQIWEVMKFSVYKGCHTAGTLPGGLQVNRRAAAINKKLLNGIDYDSYETWLAAIAQSVHNFSTISKWIGCFAMAVNEENAAFGRIVTAPTNGSAGVIPSVLHYYCCFVNQQASENDIMRFLLTASQIGALFKLNATISAAAGGCQAEIGVSSAMAAAALTECCGGSVEQALIAAEIAMEHHLGLTCDPIGGLVQIPCIERNSMGAVKAIMASNLALETEPKQAKVSLDQVLKTMWETANDMNEKYKETSTGGLAVHVTVPEC